MYNFVSLHARKSQISHIFGQACFRSVFITLILFFWWVLRVDSGVLQIVIGARRSFGSLEIHSYCNLLQTMVSGRLRLSLVMSLICKAEGSSPERWWFSYGRQRAHWNPSTSDTKPGFATSFVHPDQKVPPHGCRYLATGRIPVIQAFLFKSSPAVEYKLWCHTVGYVLVYMILQSAAGMGVVLQDKTESDCCASLVYRHVERTGLGHWGLF